MGQDDGGADARAHGSGAGDGNRKDATENSATGPDSIVKHEPELQAARERVKSLVAEFHAMGEAACDGNIHGFFGKMTGREWGITQYKHFDHHLRQFGA